MRRTEVLGAEIREIDLSRNIWTIPKERSKNRHAHTVYLSPLAAEIIKGVPRICGWHQYLFQSKSTIKFKPRPVAETTASIRRLKKLVSIDDWCLHDLRRSFTTHMAALEVPPHVLSVMLNHRSGYRSGVTAIYNRYQYAAEAKAGWELWGATLAVWVNKEYPPQKLPASLPYIDDEQVVL